MFFTSADPLYDDEIQKTASGVAVDIDTSRPMMRWDDGSAAYFLGIIDTAGLITNADITSIGGGYFFCNVDDMMVASYTVQESEELLLLLPTLLGIFVIHRCKISEGGINHHS
jgi:hypothetical protein